MQIFFEVSGYCGRISYLLGNAIEELPEAVWASAPDAPRHNTDTIKRGLDLWQAARPVRGTLAESYLTKTRKLDLATLPDIDEVLRFHPRCPFGESSRHPCLLALFRDLESDEVAGIHRVALAANAEKIDRMMLGSWPRPRAIKLRIDGEKLLVGEGIEITAYTVHRLGNVSRAAPRRTFEEHVLDEMRNAAIAA